MLIWWSPLETCFFSLQKFSALDWFGKRSAFFRRLNARYAKCRLQYYVPLDSQRERTVDCSEPVTDCHFLCISQKVGASWRNVLRKLTLDEPTIENLEEDNNTVDERFYKGLLKWKGKVGCQNATKEKLCDALREMGCSEALKVLSTLCISEKEDTSHSSDWIFTNKTKFLRISTIVHVLFPKVSNLY